MGVILGEGEKVKDRMSPSICSYRNDTLNLNGKPYGPSDDSQRSRRQMTVEEKVRNPTFCHGYGVLTTAWAVLRRRRNRHFDHHNHSGSSIFVYLVNKQIGEYWCKVIGFSNTRHFAFRPFKRAHYLIVV